MKYSFKLKTTKRIISLLLSAVLIFSLSATALAKDYNRYGRRGQPYYSHYFKANELGVVNFHPAWGNKDANTKSMISYIEKAHDKGVKILLFPEMCLTGYIYSDDPQSDDYKMIINLAESKNGHTATVISDLAKKYNMWIVYGAPELIESNKTHAYNSAFICSPDGQVKTYQKISPSEGNWCIPGENPLLIDIKNIGLIGISIGDDTYEIPEIGRYYAAKGCNILLNLSASAKNFEDIDGDGIKDDIGWKWFYKNRIESNTDRDGYTLMSANLVGSDETLTYDFPGGSVILNKGTNYYAGASINSLGNSADIITLHEGLLTNTSSLTAFTGTTCRDEDFSPEDYALWYDRLADIQDAGSHLKYKSEISDGPTAAVANMAGIWGNKNDTLKIMEEYIIEAGENDVDILVFPETVLTGYDFVDTSSDPFYKKYGVSMQIALAETIPGPSSKYLSEYAKKYGMYIIFGMPEKENNPIYDKTDGGKEKVYNSAAILFPDGRIDSYRKIHRAGFENNWSVSGNIPYIFETQWGKIGVDICRDGHFYPEIARYYAAMGCTMLIHPTATTGNPWYRETRIGSYTDRDGLAAISCNLLGPDGMYNDSDKNFSGYTYNSTSLIITKYHDKYGNVSFNSKTGSSIELNGTGPESEGFEERQSSPAGLEIAKMNLSGCGFNINNFQPRLLSKMYDELAVLYRTDYKSIYAKKGDANGDTDINIEDATFIQKVIVDLEFDNGRCDINEDGNVSIIDVTQIQKFIAEIINTL